MYKKKLEVRRPTISIDEYLRQGGCDCDTRTGGYSNYPYNTPMMRAPVSRPQMYSPSIPMYYNTPIARPTLSGGVAVTRSQNRKQGPRPTLLKKKRNAWNEFRKVHKGMPLKLVLAKYRAQQKIGGASSTTMKKRIVAKKIDSYVGGYGYGSGVGGTEKKKRF